MGHGYGVGYSLEVKQRWLKLIELELPLRSPLVKAATVPGA